MCNFIFFSTDSSEDFNNLPKELFRVYPAMPEDVDDLEAILKFEQKWYLECRYGGCSCHFRHASSEYDSGFRLPQEDDSSDDDDNVESTQAAYDLFQRLVKEGHQVDLFDAWNQEYPARIETVDVSFSKVPRNEFRFLESRRLAFVP